MIKQQSLFLFVLKHCVWNWNLQ